MGETEKVLAECVFYVVGVSFVVWLLCSGGGAV